MQKRWIALGAVGVVCVGLAGFAARSASPVVNSTVAIVDPYAPVQQAGVDASGNLKVAISGALTANQSVNVAQVAGATVATGAGTAVGALRVELPTNGTGVVGLNAGTATIGGTIPKAGTTGGATPYFIQPAASDNHATIKDGAGTAYGVVATNNSVTTNYLRLYNLGSGFNGCNSATGLLTQVAILPSGGVSVVFPVGVAFGTGLSICVTSGYATTDTTNATASAMSVTVLYN